jgi:predicted dehydrogenase
MDLNSSHLPIKVSLIGLGNVGCKYDLADKSQSLTHASAISNDPRFELIAGVDQDSHSRAIFEDSYGVRAFPTIQELMAYSKPEIVTIATKTEDHVKNIKDLLEHRTIKLLLCEKPISKNAQELKELTRDLGLSEKIVLVNYQRRTEATANEVRALIKENKFGAYLSGSGLYSRGYYNNGSHMIDLLEWWFQSKLEIVKLIELSKNSGDYDATMALKVRNRNFLLQAVPAPLASIFEITLQFEFAQLRYAAGGAQVYFDEVVGDEKFKGMRTISTSNTPAFADLSASMASVYNDIYSILLGGASLLKSAAEAMDLIYRMQGFIHGNGEINAGN